MVQARQRCIKPLVAVAEGIGGIDVEGRPVLFGKELQVDLLTVEYAFAVLELVYGRLQI